MDIKFYGTRGSRAINRRDSVRYGGNTTCVRIASPCLPRGRWLLSDAGTGISEAGTDFIKEGGKAADILQTHHHHDHNQGFPLSPFPFMKNVPVTIIGPREHDMGPAEVYAAIMKKPLFPVEWEACESHIKCIDIKRPASELVVYHPKGGMAMFTVGAFERLTNAGKEIPFEHGHFAIDECLVIRMRLTNHPEYAISYRFEERSTGKVFVFVTDHENEDGIPVDFVAHVKDADLLAIDCQYTEKKYHAKVGGTAGWGHGTPRYVTRLAHLAGVKMLGLTHHDPPSTDEVVDGIVEDARNAYIEISEGRDIPIFGCYDYQEVPV